MENHPFKYDIDFIEPGVVHFEDNIDSSFYLIEGQDKALLIDTGCGGGNVHRLASAFTDKPIDSRTGVSFDSKIPPTESGEASLGFDYVMVNGVESFVSVIVAVYDTDGQLMVTSDAGKVPTKRNWHTIVRGKFLTQTANSGVGIDPGFDGEWNIEIKHKRL